MGYTPDDQMLEICTSERAYITDGDYLSGTAQAMNVDRLVRSDPSTTRPRLRNHAYSHSYTTHYSFTAYFLFLTTTTTITATITPTARKIQIHLIPVGFPCFTHSPTLSSAAVKSLCFGYTLFDIHEYVSGVRGRAQDDTDEPYCGLCDALGGGPCRANADNRDDCDCVGD